ncbi:MAG: NAD(P)H-dependent oxidoreductase [Pseudomonadota bacterium]
MACNKSLLIVFHTQSGHTARLARAVEAGARLIEGVAVELVRASEASSADLMECSGLVICSPEYFGYMAGAVKDLFDRTYEEVRFHTQGKSYALVICAGNDGTGALTSIKRIAAGYKFREVQEPLICRGAPTVPVIDACRNLGETMAAGLDFGIF